MSGSGQKRTFRKAKAMSAIPPKADMVQHSGNVRFVPNSDVTSCRSFFAEAVIRSVELIVHGWPVGPGAVVVVTVIVVVRRCKYLWWCAPTLLAPAWL
jgi:hypothetical protein